jgi:hypothetical protein
MKPLKVMLLSSCLCLFSSPLFCANVSVLVIETGLRDGTPVRGGAVTGLWETGLMDVFFEEGHVVTNAKAFALEKKPGRELPGGIQSCLDDAGDSGMDYFVIAYLSYEMPAKAGRSSELPKPVRVEINLFSVRPPKCVWTQTVDLGQGNYPGPEEQNRAKKVARSVIMHLGDSI